MLASLSTATRKQYKSSLNRWALFCSKNNFNFFKPDTYTLMKFLTQGFNEGRAYGSLNTDRSAISLISADKIGENSLIKRLLKGCFRLKPTTSKYCVTWDVNTVLDYLEGLGASDRLSLKELSYKTVMLLALITAQRAQTLANIKISNIKSSLDKIEIIITDIIKTTRPGVANPVLILPKYDERPNLCVYSCLICYLEKSSSLRGSESYLFITLKKPHVRIGSQTIGRWLKTVLQLSGIDTEIFSSHSTRHAATSNAFASGIDIETIKRAAGWSERSNTFAKYYNKPIYNKNDSFSAFMLKRKK